MTFYLYHNKVWRFYESRWSLLILIRSQSTHRRWRSSKKRSIESRTSRLDMVIEERLMKLMSYTDEAINLSEKRLLKLWSRYLISSLSQWRINKLSIDSIPQRIKRISHQRSYQPMKRFLTPLMCLMTSESLNELFK